MTDELMAKPSHVVRRGATYYFRLRIPADLVDHYEGKKEFMFSLQTKELASAKLRAAKEQLRIQSEFAVIRNALSANLVDSMTPEEINRAALDFAHAMLSEDEDVRISGEVPDEYREGLHVIEEAARELVSGLPSSAMTHMVRQHLAEHGIKVAPLSGLEKSLTYRIAQEAVEASKRIQERERGHFVPTPPPTPLASITSKAGKGAQGGLLLSELAERYSREQEQAGNWQEKTSKENRAIYRLMREIVGDVYVYTLDFAVLREYKATLSQLPPNMNKASRYRGKSIAEILAMTDVKPMSTSSINKNLIRVSTLLDWAMRHGYIDNNYADGLTITQRGHSASKERDEFKPEHLSAIFTKLATAQTIRRGRPSNFHYWMPLLGYFTGARVNELASLRTQDFQAVDGIPCVNITQQNDGKKKTKTSAGNRTLPLHPELIRLGILEYVQEVQPSGEGNIFPELPLTANGYGDKVSKWFSGHNAREDGFLWRSGVQAEKVSFHSFRHTVTTLLERADVSPILAKRIMGHAFDDETYGRYSKGSTPQQMLEGMVRAIHAEPTLNMPTFTEWKEKART